MKKRMRVSKTWLVAILIILFAAAGTAYALWPNPTPTNSTAPTAGQQPSSPRPQPIDTGTADFCAKHNLSKQVCDRVKATGEYCASWSAQPGSMTPDYCIRLHQ